MIDLCLLLVFTLIVNLPYILACVCKKHKKVIMNIITCGCSVYVRRKQFLSKMTRYVELSRSILQLIRCLLNIIILICTKDVC